MMKVRNHSVLVLQVPGHVVDEARLGLLFIPRWVVFWADPVFIRVNWLWWVVILWVKLVAFGEIAGCVEVVVGIIIGRDEFEAIELWVF